MIDLGIEPERRFAPDYATARRRFLAQCERHGVAVDSRINPRRGPQGEELATDLAWFGARDAPAVMVLVSATHGVEGSCGSACQLDWLLRAGPAHLPDGVAALLVHAINPYGFAWARRVTEDGVDLNRNGVDFAAPLPANADYAALADAILPARFDGPAFDAAERRLAAFAAAHGEARLLDALGAGQYSHPLGIFYGGTAPTWSRRTTESLIADHALGRRRLVAVVDYHTGLGAHGHGEPICGHRPGEPGQARCRAWYGASLGEPLLGTSASRPIPGLMQYAWSRLLGPERATFIALEFGTYDGAIGRRALREEHWLQAHGASEAETRRIKGALLDFYNPQALAWREMVLFRSRQIINQTLAGLAAPAPTSDEGALTRPVAPD